MEKQKKEPLATEIIQEQEQELSRILVELETLKADAERAKFPLDELMELTGKAPKGQKEFIRFANNQHRFIAMLIWLSTISDELKAPWKI